MKELLFVLPAMMNPLRKLRKNDLFSYIGLTLIYHLNLSNEFPKEMNAPKPLTKIYKRILPLFFLKHLNPTFHIPPGYLLTTCGQ